MKLFYHQRRLVCLLKVYLEGRSSNFTSATCSIPHIKDTEASHLSVHALLYLPSPQLHPTGLPTQFIRNGITLMLTVKTNRAGLRGGGKIGRKQLVAAHANPVSLL